MTPGVFGEWDAPATDGLPTIETPVGEKCFDCEETIAAGDNGMVNLNGLIVHRECSLRMVLGGIGHLVDHDRYCLGVGPDAGLARRTSALLVWEWFMETGMAPTVEQVSAWQLRLADLEQVMNGLSAPG